MCRYLQDACSKKASAQIEKSRIENKAVKVFFNIWKAAAEANNTPAP